MASKKTAHGCRVAGGLGEDEASSEPVPRKSEGGCRVERRGVDPVRRESEYYPAMRPPAIVSTEGFRARDADWLGRVGVYGLRLVGLLCQSLRLF